MSRSLFLILVLCVQYVSLYAQQDQLFPFKINGTVDADTGTIQLRLLADTSFYPKNLRNLSAKVENKKFTFEGYLSTPQGFGLVYEPKYLSALFIVQAGAQTINVRLDSNKKTPEVLNSIMQSDHREFTKEFRNTRHKRFLLDKKWDSLLVVYNNKLPHDIKLSLTHELKESYNDNDKTLLNYASTHPNSYVAFWKLVDLLKFGYEPIFDSIFYQLSDSIKSSYAGRNYAEMIKSAGMLSIGKAFPSILITDSQNKKFNTVSIIKNKYTLIDFWYSNCGPCLAQFPDLSRIYDKYKSRGFEIAAISTDKLKDKEKWLATIKKSSLLWSQYWDVDGKESTKLAIAAFPTNFLVDREGKIIKKNIHPVELEEFLNKVL